MLMQVFPHTICRPLFPLGSLAWVSLALGAHCMGAALVSDVCAWIAFVGWALLAEYPEFVVDFLQLMVNFELTLDHDGSTSGTKWMPKGYQNQKTN